MKCQFIILSFIALLFSNVATATTIMLPFDRLITPFGEGGDIRWDGVSGCGTKIDPNICVQMTEMAKASGCITAGEAHYLKLVNSVAFCGPQNQLLGWCPCDGNPLDQFD